MECGVEHCPKGGAHKEPYQATACWGFHTYYAGGKRAVVVTAKASGPDIAEKVERAAELHGAGKARQVLAKELGIKCWTWMEPDELDAAINAAQRGDLIALPALEDRARQRSRASWDAWKAKRQLQEVVA